MVKNAIHLTEDLYLEYMKNSQIRSIIKNNTTRKYEQDTNRYYTEENIQMAVST